MHSTVLYRRSHGPWLILYEVICIFVFYSVAPNCVGARMYSGLICPGTVRIALVYGISTGLYQRSHAQLYKLCYAFSCFVCWFIGTLAM